MWVLLANKFKTAFPIFHPWLSTTLLTSKLHCCCATSTGHLPNLVKLMWMPLTYSSALSGVRSYGRIIMYALGEWCGRHLHLPAVFPYISSSASLLTFKRMHSHVFRRSYSGHKSTLGASTRVLLDFWITSWFRTTAIKFRCQQNSRKSCWKDRKRLACPHPVITIYLNFSSTAKDIPDSTVIQLTLHTFLYCTLPWTLKWQLRFGLHKTDWLSDKQPWHIINLHSWSLMAYCCCFCIANIGL